MATTNTIQITVTRHFPGKKGDRYGQGATDDVTFNVLEVTLRNTDFQKLVSDALLQLNSVKPADNENN